MRLIKNEFFRFFTLGFAGGAMLVIGTMHLGPVGAGDASVIPAAHAAATR